MPVAAPLYPVSLIVAGRPCLVVGGGRVAARKVEGLRDCGGLVTVVAPEIGPAIRAWADVRCERRGYRRGEVAGYWLAIAATDAAEVNRAVHEDAQAARVWVNAADDPAHCSFTLPSVLRRGALSVAVSTGGHSPGLAAWLRRRLEAEVGPEYGTLVDLLSAAREEVQASGRSTEGLSWQSLLDSDILASIRSGRLDEARESVRTWLSSSSG